MKQRQLTDVMSEKDIKIADIREKQKLLQSTKGNIKLEDLMKNLVLAISDIKEVLKSSKDIPKENTLLMNNLIKILKEKEVIINIPHKRILKTATPIRNDKGIAIKYEFEWCEEEK
jgi:hypothetical protein